MTYKNWRYRFATKNTGYTSFTFSNFYKANQPKHAESTKTNRLK